jgi:hypothetical protein
MDIRSTLANVCFKLLHDHSVSNEVLAKRAKALKVLGELFLSKGGSMAAGLGDIRSKLASQMHGGAAGAADKDKEEDSGAEAGAAAPTTTPAAAAAAVPEPAPAAASAPAPSAQEQSADASNLD